MNDDKNNFLKMFQMDNPKKLLKGIYFKLDKDIHVNISAH